MNLIFTEVFGCQTSDNCQNYAQFYYFLYCNKKNHETNKKLKFVSFYISQLTITLSETIPK